MIDAYPLTWPMGWPRTERPEWSRFKASHSGAMYDLLNELRLLDAKNVIISTNLPLRRDGLPYASRHEPQDSGVAVYFDLDGQPQCIPCDKWNSVRDNLHAISKTINALRGIERWGAKEMVNAAFRGFKALPAQGDTTPSAQRLWFDVLEVSPDASWDVIEAVYRRLLHKVHPDKGGSEAAFHELQAAFKQAKEIYRK